MSTSNPYAAKTTDENAEVASSDTEEAKALEVPAGSVSEVLAWVGEDQERAAAALEAEKTGHARKTLVAKLEELTTDDAKR